MVTQTHAGISSTTSLAEFLADKDAVVEWHLLPEPDDVPAEDEWAPEYDDDADRLAVTQTQTQGVDTA